jgi:hypothetical protein
MGCDSEICGRPMQQCFETDTVEVPNVDNTPAAAAAAAAAAVLCRAVPRMLCAPCCPASWRPSLTC